MPCPSNSASFCADPILANSLLLLYLRTPATASASRGLFDEMPERTASAYNTFISPSPSPSPSGSDSSRSSCLRARLRTATGKKNFFVEELIGLLLVVRHCIAHLCLVQILSRQT
ncbi:hypothetical protein GUJ93_ZPchr0002g23208 [Zizania palustris]|uniref:Uncharacterized protein n=1 Tax=Zizania palustris TaxID=103762 RepID=A0A8J5SIW7_ZIZPA|nr:hypothetical protein GUJ93_ZPchr0002g23208 [Zizania palustris]